MFVDVEKSAISAAKKDRDFTDWDFAIFGSDPLGGA